MLVTVETITQDYVMNNAMTFRANAEARYGVVPDWEQAFAAVPCASCSGLEILSKEGFCQDCDEMGLAKKEVAASRSLIHSDRPRCGCDRSRLVVLRCGHCACRCECEWDCPVDPCRRCGKMLTVEDVEVTEECPNCINDPF